MLTTIAERHAGVSVQSLRCVLGKRTVLDELVIQVPLQGRLGIVGRSGSGKSTLLSLVAGLGEPDAGTITLAGGAALMPQRDCLLPWRSALDNACLPLENRGIRRPEARRQAAALFGRVGLSGAEQLQPSELSGGMRQRVAFVRTLLADKQVLLLDEPFGALDAITRAELQDWLLAVLATEPRTVLLVTHDVEEALLLCEKVAVLAGGRIAASVDVEVDRERPRREVVSDPAFVALRERLLEAIE